MFRHIKIYSEKINRKFQWRKKNAHNQTALDCSIDLECVEVGNFTYGVLKVLNFNNNFKLKIGHFCSIASGVVFILNADHRIDTISTYPFKVKCLQTDKCEAVSKGDIVVDDDVWIGQNAIILSGVHVGQGAVVAAGAIVTKDIPPYAVVGGNPARIIKYRFSDDIIEELLKVDYGQLTKEMISEHINALYDKLESPEQLEWMPKK